MLSALCCSRRAKRSAALRLIDIDASYACKVFTPPLFMAQCIGCWLKRCFLVWVVAAPEAVPCLACLVSRCHTVDTNR
jgi:hypothetical protein